MNDQEILNYFEKQAATGEWNALYDSKNPSSYPFIIRLVKAIELINKVEDKIVLDLGCGTGILIQYINENKGNYIGLDISENMLNIIRNQYHDLIEDGKINLFSGDVRDYKPKGNIDIMVGLGFIEYFDNPEIIINKLFELLPEGGQLILSYPNFLSFDYLTIKLLSPLRFIMRKVTGKHTITPPRKMWNSKVAQEMLLNAGFKNLNTVYYNVNIFSYPFTRLSVNFTSYWAKKFEYSILSKIGLFASGFIISAEK